MKPLILYASTGTHDEVHVESNLLYMWSFVARGVFTQSGGVAAIKVSKITPPSPVKSPAGVANVAWSKVI